MDRILGAEGDSPNNYKLSKQADTCMLFYLLSHEELIETMGNLGYLFNRDLIEKNIKYYLERTTHGSTLSLMVYCSVLYYFNREEAWKLYKEYVLSDVHDIQGGTVAEGIHTGTMAGSINFLLFQLGGLKNKKDCISLHPMLPKDLECMVFRFQYRRDWLSVKIDKKECEISAEANSHSDKIFVRVNGKMHQLLPGSSIRVDLSEYESNSSSVVESM